VKAGNYGPGIFGNLVAIGFGPRRDVA